MEQSQDNVIIDSVDSGYELSQSCKNENSLSTFEDSYGDIWNADHVTIVTDDYRYDVDTWNNKSFKVYVASKNYESLSDVKIKVLVTKLSNNKVKTFEEKTGSNGFAYFYLEGIEGKCNVDFYNAFNNEKITTFNGYIYPNYCTINSPAVTHVYNTNKYLKIKAVDWETNKPVKNIKFRVLVYTGKKYKSYAVKTNNAGVAKLSTKKIGYGNHKVVIYPIPYTYDGYQTTKIKIIGKKVKVTAPKIKAKIKTDKFFKIKIKNYKSKKPIKGLKLKVKVFTGKKYKTYIVKTNNKGVAKFSTKKLKVGTHKVVISSKNKKFTADKKSSIKIYDPTIHTKTYKLKSYWEPISDGWEYTEKFRGSIKVGKGDMISSEWAATFSPQANDERIFDMQCYSDDFYPNYHKIIKTKIYYKNDDTGKVMSKTYNVNGAVFYVKTPYGYTPYKVSVTYKSYSKKIRW